MKPDNFTRSADMNHHIILTNLSISHSRLWMQSSFLLRQRRAAIRFLLRRRTSCTKSSCSRVRHCVFSICWKSLRLSDTIPSTENGSCICARSWGKNQSVCIWCRVLKAPELQYLLKMFSFLCLQFHFNSLQNLHHSITFKLGVLK